LQEEKDMFIDEVCEKNTLKIVVKIKEKYYFQKYIVGL
jgi:hypothetical protein